jgi:hypothetical protein
VGLFRFRNDLSPVAGRLGQVRAVNEEQKPHDNSQLDRDHCPMRGFVAGRYNA